MYKNHKPHSSPCTRVSYRIKLEYHLALYMKMPNETLPKVPMEHIKLLKATMNL